VHRNRLQSGRGDGGSSGARRRDRRIGSGAARRGVGRNTMKAALNIRNTIGRRIDMRNSLKSRGARNADRYGISATMRIVYAVLILLVIPAWNAAADPEADRIMREVERNERSSHSSMELVMTVYDDGRVSSAGKRFSIRLLS